MTEGELNLLEVMIANTLERASASRCEGRGAEAVVGARWLASVLVDNERLRRRETELQSDNTRLHLKAEAALNREHNLMREVDALRDVLGQGDGSKVALTQRDEAILKARIAEQGYESARAVLADVTKERDEARALNGEMAANLDRAKGDSDAASRTIGDLTRELDTARTSCHQWRSKVDAARAVMSAERDESIGEAAKRLVAERNDATAALVAANASIAECRQALLDAQRDMVSVTESRDVLASWRAIPPELARLYRAAQRSIANAKYHVTAQRWKLSEECGEFVAAWCKDAARTAESEIKHEIHDVLTVALSLCEPALMARAAERLEGRLAT